MFLGHGNKTSCDRPRVIEALRGKDIIFIACGGAHSAAITATGNHLSVKRASMGNKAMVGAQPAQVQVII